MNQLGDNPVELELDLVEDKLASYLVSDGTREIHLPKKLVTYDGDGIFTVPLWLAHDRGLV